MTQHYEREFVNLLEGNSFAVMRAPSSGSATERELPDVIALKGGEHHPFLPSEALAVEHKANAKHHIYLTEDEVDKLKVFAQAGGLQPLLAGRWKRDHDTGWNQHNETYDTTAHYLLEPRQCYRTDEGNYRLTRPDKSQFEAWPGLVVTEDDVYSGLGPNGEKIKIEPGGRES